MGRRDVRKRTCPAVVRKAIAIPPRGPSLGLAQDPNAILGGDRLHQMFIETGGFPVFRLFEAASSRRGALELATCN